ncbi:MAG: hypothetical protein JJU02_12830 [Cryomorphaceae bacterium]|nr:hypothetical protein [Cryomorphaceae bacterium]
MKKTFFALLTTLVCFSSCDEGDKLTKLEVTLYEKDGKTPIPNQIVHIQRYRSDFISGSDYTTIYQIETNEQGYVEEYIFSEEYNTTHFKVSGVFQEDETTPNCNFRRRIYEDKINSFILQRSKATRNITFNMEPFLDQQKANNAQCNLLECGNLNVGSFDAGASFGFIFDFAVIRNIGYELEVNYMDTLNQWQVGRFQFSVGSSDTTMTPVL